MANRYDELRSAFLRPGDGPFVQGAAFEVGTAGACASVLCHVDGRVSLYLSSGGGQLGLGEHAPERSAARDYLDLLGRSLPLLSPVDAAPCVEQGHVAFTAVTRDGVHHLALSEREAVDATAATAGLLAAGQDVVTRIRVLDEVRRGERSA